MVDSIYKKSWVSKYFNYSVKDENGIVSFYNSAKDRTVSEGTTSRFSVWIKMNELTKLYFNTVEWWNANLPNNDNDNENEKWIQVSKLSNFPHGFITNNAPGTKAHLYVPPFFVVYRTSWATTNFLAFKEFNQPNIEQSILAMLSFDEEQYKLNPLFTPHIILPYSNVLTLNNILEFKLIDSQDRHILVSDKSQLFILLTII
jgi:hypothetical protein